MVGACVSVGGVGGQQFQRTMTGRVVVGFSLGVHVPWDFIAPTLARA